MLAWLRMMWVTVRDSLWFIPSVMTLLAAVLAVLLVQVESAFELQLNNERHFLVGGSVDGARSVLSTIAGSIMTVTGVVFSITIVTLQLASSQFTPRILRNFLADRSNQLVLGVFIATFTYTLLVLRTVRSIDDGDEFVPEIAVTVAIFFALVSIGFLIHFIHHAALSVQATVILSRVSFEALGRVERLFPEEIGEPETTPPPKSEIPTGTAELVAAKREGYLQTVDSQSLFQLGEERRLVIQMIPRVGEFLIQGQPLARVWADEPLPDEIHTAIQHAFILGADRSPEQDLEFYLLEIADMAVKALSPGINDPTTAIYCIDRLTQLLAAFGKRRPPEPLRTESGDVHFLARPSTFAEAVDLSLDQILHYGHDNPLIVGKLRHAIDLLLELTPSERHEPLRDFQRKLTERETDGGEG